MRFVGAVAVLILLVVFFPVGLILVGGLLGVIGGVLGAMVGVAAGMFGIAIGFGLKLFVLVVPIIAIALIIAGFLRLCRAGA